MPIEFRCPHCGRLLRTPDGSEGKDAQCPECHAIARVPESGAGAGGASAGSPFGDLGTGSPFSEPAAGYPRSEEGYDPENPYQSPTQYGEISPIASTEQREYARLRVAGPATALIITGALGIAVQLASLAMNLASIGMQGPNINGPEMPLMLGVFCGMAMLPIALGALIVFGAVKMKNLESYGLAMASAIVAMIPCISPCCLLGLPFGIWALVVLSDPAVKASFPR